MARASVPLPTAKASLAEAARRFLTAEPVDHDEVREHHPRVLVAVAASGTSPPTASS